MTVPVGAAPPEALTAAESTTDALYTDGSTEDVRTVVVESGEIVKGMALLVPPLVVIVSDWCPSEAVEGIV
jgi:hypothetical protein